MYMFRRLEHAQIKSRVIYCLHVPAGGVLELHACLVRLQVECSLLTFVPCVETNGGTYLQRAVHFISSDDCT